MQENNNIINIRGTVDNQISLSHQLHNEKFYIFNIKIKRFSQTCDILPVIISDRLISSDNIKNITKQKVLDISGQIRSHNDYINNKMRLILRVFVQKINFNINILDNKNQNINQVFLNGYICKQPTYRTTPFGREITDILLAVNRQHNKSDYIPCIAWGRNAKLASKLNIGDNIKLQGRMQSREYQKKISDNETITKIAYELSISKIDLI